MGFWTSEDFQRGARRLVQVSEGLEASSGLLHWSIKDVDDATCFLFHPPVARNCTIHMHTPISHCCPFGEHNGPESNDSTEEIIWSDETLNEDPDSYLAKADVSNQIETEWRFSIVYSDTWRVPLLYFHVQHLDGTPCSRTDVLDMLKSSNHQNQVEDSWDFLSQEEHPVTRLPSFFLHPCRTKERLDTLQASTDDEAVRLLSWMSMILPSVGYSISSKEFRQVKHGLEKDNR
jgi:hypothetical protein